MLDKVHLQPYDTSGFTCLFGFQRHSPPGWQCRLENNTGEGHHLVDIADRLAPLLDHGCRLHFLPRHSAVRESDWLPTKNIRRERLLRLSCSSWQCLVSTLTFEHQSLQQGHEKMSSVAISGWIFAWVGRQLHLPGLSDTALNMKQFQMSLAAPLGYLQVR